ncbi:MAG: class I SAM-dependent DNA methyltransferase [Candidatus Coatesbacteria bacterium]
MTPKEIENFIWGVADLIRDSFKRGKYQDVILPLTVLRRIDCVLAPTREEVRKAHARFKATDLRNADPQLRKASGFAFYNTSKYDFESLAGDHANIVRNLRAYIAGFSVNMREVIEKFDFDNTITKLNEAGLLFMVVERFKGIQLHPKVVDNHQMGTIFEGLIRRFNEALDENPGEHFTPRDVVALMVRLLIRGDEERLRRKGAVVTAYDPCCGSGGMLSIAKELIRGDGKPGINPNADVHLFGQEVNPETFAVCKSDLFLKDPPGHDADNIAFGSTLSADRHAGRGFDYLIANPPYGKDWKRDEEAVRLEHSRGTGGRFGVGLPRISDGQLLFLQHMLSHMNAPKQGGSRVAIIMNGSPLFTGDAGSGESEIRRWVLENDWLEALIALPEEMFYNTGIATYVWVLTNRKAGERRGKVQLIDATSDAFWEKEAPSLGKKRRKISVEKAQIIIDLVRSFKEGEYSKVYPTATFGFRKIVVERPLRLKFEITKERLSKLEEEPAFRGLAESKKKAGKAHDEEIEEGRGRQAAIRKVLGSLEGRRYTSREAFLKDLTGAEHPKDLKWTDALQKSLVRALGEPDEHADLCRDKDGRVEPDSELRDNESVPLGESVEEYFVREVKPFVPDAWISTESDAKDPKDGLVGKVGYEINFNRYFYKYQPPRPLEEIEADIRKIEADITGLMAKGAADPPKG